MADATDADLPPEDHDDKVAAPGADGGDALDDHERSMFDPKWQRWSHRNTNYRNDETINFL